MTLGSDWGQIPARRPGHDTLGACYLSTFDLVRGQLRVELAGGLEPPTACLQDRSATGCATPAWCLSALLSAWTGADLQATIRQ